MDICSICHEKLDHDIVIIKHHNDPSLTISRKRGHYFHKSCIQLWKKEYLAQHEDQPNISICPLDRDAIGKIYNVPTYELLGFDLEDYDQDFRVTINTLKITDKVLDQFTAINELDKNNRTLAYHVCKRGNLPLVLKLLKRGADFNIGTGNHQFTPLMAAVCYNHYEIVKKLLNNKKVSEHCQAEDDCGRTAFSFACEHSFVSIITEFLNLQLVNANEVRYHLKLYQDKYHKDTLYGYEIISKMYHYLTKCKK